MFDEEPAGGGHQHFRSEFCHVTTGC
jgi:hypothetical protein